MLRLGYKASAEQFGPRDLLRFACAAERAGFDSVFVSDHFQPWRHTGGHAPFSMAWLGALGARTSRVLMGTSVLTPTFRYHPSIVAQAFGTLGSLFPGRVILGIGTGEALNDVPATGMVWPPFKERFGRLREAVTLIRKLWSEERVSFAGEFYRTENATIYDRPDEPIPLYISAGGALSRSSSAAPATDSSAPAASRGRSIARNCCPISPAASQRPRAEDSVERMIEMKVSFDTDRARARDDTRHWAALALTAEEKLAVEDPREMERLADALPVERAASRWIVSSDPGEQVEAIRPYVEMGFRHLVFHAPGPDQERFLELYARDVLPRLRRAFG